MANPNSSHENVQEKNRIFYNEISTEYNQILEQEGSNEIVRTRVKQKFTKTVGIGKVLDFGGGTGLDLKWLLSNHYQVVFCEPSEGMRNKAIEQYAKKDVLFLKNDQADFTSWQDQPPFSGEVNGVLANFAVFNCIENIDGVFRNLSKLIEPRGHLIALMLNPLYKRNGRSKFRHIIRSLFSPGPAMINVQYKTCQQVVYLYSLKEIKRASSPFFELSGQEDLFNFTLFHFIKK